MSLRSACASVVGVILLLGIAAPRAFATPASCGPRNTPDLVYPGDPRWLLDKNVYPANTNFANAAITGTNPRSGNGSLELTTTGSLFDWAFFKRAAEPWGLLSAVNCLTFDWWRDSYTLPNPAPPELTAETWQEQTPVLRLLIRDLQGDQPVFSQLVWERWYNTRNSLVPTENDQWNFENLTGQLFWRNFDGGLTYTNLGCINTSFDGSDALQTYNLGGWVSNCYSASAQVYGIMIGVGSMWPGSYRAFLDNVQLSFNGQPGFAVEDNFELPASVAPEPASLTLLATGLLILGAAAWFKRRRSSRI